MFENKNGTLGDDVLLGGNGNVMLVGGEGNDYLSGLSTFDEPGANGLGSLGPIYMYGGDGNDRFNIGIDSKSGKSLDGGSFVTVLDYNAVTENDSLNIRAQNVEFLDSLEIQQFTGSDARSYSNIFFDTDNSGSADNLVAQVRGDSFISASDIVNF